MILKKECIAMFPTLALIEIRQKKAGFKGKARFLKHLKKPEVRPIYMGSYPISAYFYTLPFSYFFFACTFFTLHFVKHKEKHLKCEQIWKFLSYFYFLRSG